MRLIDADALADKLEQIISDYTSHGMYPAAFDIRYATDVVEDMPTLTPPNEWISVEEKLPESIVNKVLVYCENGYIGYGHYEKYQGEETWYNLESGEPFSSWNWQNCSPYKVTHWMPLPEAPDNCPPEGEEDT